MNQLAHFFGFSCCGVDGWMDARMPALPWPVRSCVLSLTLWPRQLPACLPVFLPARLTFSSASRPHLSLSLSLCVCGGLTHSCVPSIDGIASFLLCMLARLPRHPHLPAHGRRFKYNLTHPMPPRYVRQQAAINPSISQSDRNSTYT